MADKSHPSLVAVATLRRPPHLAPNDSNVLVYHREKGTPTNTIHLAFNSSISEEGTRLTEESHGEKLTSLLEIFQDCKPKRFSLSILFETRKTALESEKGWIISNAQV